MKVVVDTNVLVRSVMDDDPGQAIIARRVLSGASVIVIPVLCFAELAWVLRRSYRIANSEIASVIRTFADSATVETDQRVVEAGIAMLEAGGDFADGAIAADGMARGGETFVSFDRRAVDRLLAQGQRALMAI